MSLILNIDTATEVATVCISKNQEVLEYVTNARQKDHASFLQPAIKELLQRAGLSVNQLLAVSVTAGPGSYTGLRVGMASAKGLCFALNIPLITISTLKLIALSAIQLHPEKSNMLYCPMIDARRMEVFTAVYDKDLSEIAEPCSMILDSSSFNGLLQKNKITFCGSGASKFKLIPDNDNAIFTDVQIQPEALAVLSYKKFQQSTFANLFYSEPFYIKNFMAPGEKNNP